MMRAIFLTGLTIVAATYATGQNANPRDTAWGELGATMRGDMYHRLQALAAIGTISNTDDRAVQMAENALRDHDAQVRVAAANALGEMKATQAAPALKAALDDTGEVAFAAAKALCDMGDPAGRDMLVAVIAGERKDTPGIMTNAIRDARKKIHHPEGILLMGGQDAAGAMFGPASMGIVAVKDAFKLRGVSGQASAAESLAKDPETYAVTLLEWALTDDKWEVRAAAAKALGERGTLDSIPPLEKAMIENKHTAIRTLAAASIIRIDDRLATSAASAPR
jgi:HEAT repeat protein